MISRWLEKLYNHCTDCGVRIPWKKRAFFGNTYKPVICQDCVDIMSIKVYGSLHNYELARIEAIRKEISDHK